MEKHHFKTDGKNPSPSCIEPCMVKNNETKIGSFACSVCEHNFGYKDYVSGKGGWIKCAKIEEATKKPNP